MWAMTDTKIELLPVQRVSHPPPETFPREYGEGMTAVEHELPATSALELRGAKVNHEGLVFRPWPLEVSFARPYDGDRFRRLPRRVRFAMKNYVLRWPQRTGCLLWCIDNLSPDNWYHWLTEVLPRIHLARRLFSGVDHISFPAYYRRRSFVEETLMMWPDLPPILWVGNRRRVLADRLVLIERAAPPWDYRGSVMKDLVDHLVCQAQDGASSTPAPRRIYVSRADAAWRRVANEHEVRDFLEQKGFLSIEASQFSVREQIKLFRSASAVIGAHGAGLANMIFCKPGAVVREFATRDPHQHWRCYHSLAHAMGHRYGVVVSDSTAGPDADFDTRRDADLVVNIDHLASALDGLS